MANLQKEPRREQSLWEELANSISHGLGLVAALIGTPFLLMEAARHEDTPLLVGTSVFAATLILLYLASTIYHAFPRSKTKQVFRVIEHSAIFLLIAGTYTPLTLGVLRGTWGWILFGVVWSIALIGVTLKVFGKASHPIISNGLYLLLGWAIVIAYDPVMTRIPTAGLLLLVAGGLAYTVGVIFYATDARLHYGHLVWHLFVMAGSTCHYFAILWYAV